MDSNSDLDNITSTAANTIELLESRLRRLEYLLTGDSSWTGGPGPVGHSGAPASADESATARLAGLEYELKRLGTKVPAVNDVLGLYSRFPDLFQSSSPSNIPTTLSPQALTSLVLSYAAAFPETASRLTSLKDLPIPPAELSTSLIELQPRLDKLAAVQEQQAQEVDELRAKSALLMKRWIEVGVVSGGEVWGEWEARLERVERGVRRAEGRNEREER